MRIFSFFSKSIFPILLVNFIGILGYSIVIPILIFIVTDLGGNGFIYGILGAMYPFFQFIGAPILGRLSDRIGRKKVLVISQAGTFVAWTLFLIALILPETELWSSDSEFTGSYMMTLPLILLFLARIFDGFTGGNVSVANAYLSDISTDEDRDKNFGMMGASTSLGFVLGPAVAGILASTILGEILPIILAAIISLVAILVIFIRLPESNPCMVDTGDLNFKSFRRFFQVEHKDCFSGNSIENEVVKSDNSFKGVLGQKGIPLLFSIYFLTFLAFSLFYAGLPIYASTMLEWTAVDLGIFLAYSSFIMILVQGPLLSFLSGKVPNIRLVAIGAVLLSLSFFLLSNPSIIILYLANTLLSLGNGLMWPSFLSLLSKTGNSTMQGAIQGYGNSMGSLASIFGLVLGGIMFESIDVTIFIIGSGIFLLILILLFINYILTKNASVEVDQTVAAA
ncbi:MFS transporter [Aquimarina sp. BL5]|uniref:MFS transporter n=1 Tax=Aquimarina sp. BL5 TaxID=1714860 RepID=UPI000E4E255D|nr:MFS transporter [Aquimarina sp. BL5]AXT50046.1 MFS transporter [Aquimarina sp. BL5]RKN00312.1 MFS transporter [Aquimarina sp. BL5]